MSRSYGGPYKEAWPPNSCSLSGIFGKHFDTWLVECASDNISVFMDIFNDSTAETEINVVVTLQLLSPSGRETPPVKSA
jgi:hypothetical protein